LNRHTPPFFSFFFRIPGIRPRFGPEQIRTRGRADDIRLMGTVASGFAADRQTNNSQDMGHSCLSHHAMRSQHGSRNWYAAGRPAETGRSLPGNDRLFNQFFDTMFRGELVTETMLVRNENDSEADLELLGRFLARLKPARAYLSLPTRPPAERWVAMPEEDCLNRAYQLLHGSGIEVELLAEYEGTAFSSLGDVAEDLLAITSVHPMREDAVRALLLQAGGDWSMIRELLSTGQLIETDYKGEKYYLKKFCAGQAGNQTKK